MPRADSSTVPCLVQNGVVVEPVRVAKLPAQALIEVERARARSWP